MSDETIQVRIDLKGDTKKMFDFIKDKYNLQSNAEVIRLVIKVAYVKESSDKL